jgi:ADP-ribosylglycohydrolase
MTMTELIFPWPEAAQGPRIATAIVRCLQRGELGTFIMGAVTLTAAQLDRACGVLLATAAGDALGAGYELGPPLPLDEQVNVKGGGTFGWAPGEWTDDTSMAVAIAETAASGADLRTAAAQDAVTARWCAWATEAPDAGAQTADGHRRPLRRGHAPPCP